MLVQMFVVELLLCSKDGLRSDLRASKLQGEHAPRLLQLYTHTSNPATSNMHDDYGPVDHSPVLAEYTPIYMVWVTFIASGISQR